MIGGYKLRRNLKVPLKVVGFLIPIFIVVFALMVQIATPEPNVVEVIKFATISVAWIVLALVQLISKKHGKLILFLYHILASISIISMYGIMSPFIPFWILLALSSYVNYQGVGLTLSLIWLVFTMSINTALTIEINPNAFLYEISTIASVFIASYVIVMLSKEQKDAQSALNNSKKREILQRNRLLSIINNQSDGIISVDNNGNIRVFNAASMWLLDTNEDLIKKKINTVFPIYDLEKNPLNTFKTLSSYKTNTARDDILFKTKEGEMLRFEVTFAPIRQAYGKKKTHEEIDGYILIFRDITKEKTLDDERDEFISVVSHELRTPVTVAEGAVSNAQVLFDSPKAPKEAIRGSLKIAHDQVIFLAGLVNDLSTLSRAQRNVMSDPEIMSLKDLGHQTLERYRSEAEQKGLTLDLDMSAQLGSVYTSKLYLEELLQNLVLNAIKYTQTGGVTIKLEKKGKKVKFSIIDTGIGISRSERDKIFEKFYRSEDYRTREKSGTGLGLYLSAQLADKMGAWLKLTSRLNHGSTFFFELPLHEDNSKGQ